MMTYEIFKEKVVERFADYMPEKLEGEVRVQQVNKVNCCLDGLYIDSKSGTSNRSPVIYINNMYDAYKNGRSLEDILKKVLLIL